MASEFILNYYYNIGGFNRPSRIGYMMKMIRELNPLTEREWYLWYVVNVHDEVFLKGLAMEMHQMIPSENNVSFNDCLDYIHDVMFRRTFQGYNKEQIVLHLLQSLISKDIKESPPDWDTKYFIDFYGRTKDGRLIGIQLKPETFYVGHYDTVVHIEEKMLAFANDYDASVYVLRYVVNDDGDISFVNVGVIDALRMELALVKRDVS